MPWRADAVSALIHAATMVTAGVYMVVRMNAVYQLAPFALDVVAVIGAVTAVFAASMALVQNDIKKVLAYSTISQLGYMFLALAWARLLRVFSLDDPCFLQGLAVSWRRQRDSRDVRGTGSAQDGGLWNKISTTARTFLIATLAICGIFPFAGFFSKDEILGRAIDRYFSLWLIGFITAGMTAFTCSGCSSWRFLDTRGPMNTLKSMFTNRPYR